MVHGCLRMRTSFGRCCGNAATSALRTSQAQLTSRPSRIARNKARQLTPYSEDLFYVFLAILTSSTMRFGNSQWPAGLIDASCRPLDSNWMPLTVWAGRHHMSDQTLSSPSLTLTWFIRLHHAVLPAQSSCQSPLPACVSQEHCLPASVKNTACPRQSRTLPARVGQDRDLRERPTIASHRLDARAVLVEEAAVQSCKRFLAIGHSEKYHEQQQLY